VSLSSIGNLEYLPCSGNGRCLSLREVAANPDYVHYFSSFSYEDWDADRIFGCVCYEGWFGVACDELACTYGDNPMTPGVDEVQIIDCMCETCKGGVVLSARGEKTNLIPFHATAEFVQMELESLSAIEKVDVQIPQGGTLCSYSGSITQVMLYSATTSRYREGLHLWM
jgi:hypothetical protein